MTEAKPPFNTRAALSALFAVLTALSFCVGAAPIPLTALVCYPAAVLLGAVSLWTGWIGLQEIRQRGGRGRRLALIGLWAGGVIILAVLCFSAISIVLFPSLFDYLRQVWEQVSVS